MVDLSYIIAHAQYFFVDNVMCIRGCPKCYSFSSIKLNCFFIQIRAEVAVVTPQNNCTKKNSLVLQCHYFGFYPGDIIFYLCKNVKYYPFVSQAFYSLSHACFVFNILRGVDRANHV